MSQFTEKEIDLLFQACEHYEGVLLKEKQETPSTAVKRVLSEDIEGFKNIWNKLEDLNDNLPANQ